MFNGKEDEYSTKKGGYEITLVYSYINIESPTNVSVYKNEMIVMKNR